MIHSQWEANMKKLLYLLLLIATPVFGRIVKPHDFGPLNSETLATVINLIGSNEAQIEISAGQYLMYTNLMFPTNMHVVVSPGAGFLVTNKVVLTFNGSLSAGPYRIFEGYGIVTGAAYIAETHIQWTPSDMTNYLFTFPRKQLADVVTSDEIANATITSNQIARLTISTNNLAENLFTRLIPVGTILPFGGLDSKQPVGFLMCDGSAYTSAAYPALFNVIGTGWGDGSTLGSGQFNVPDLRGTFLRGDNDMYDTRVGHWADATAAFAADDYSDPDTHGAWRVARHAGGGTGLEVGSFQMSTFENHTHVIQSTVSGEGTSIPHMNVVHEDANSVNNTENTQTYETGQDESRPVNASVKFIIKY